MRLEDADRLRTLLDTGIAISSELSLDAVLERIIEAAARLTGARYAALGVIDPSGTGLERFVYTGIEQREADAIGDLPRGRGILGVLIEDARPLRLPDLRDDPRWASHRTTPRCGPSSAFPSCCATLPTEIST